jgi:hypothetical protein
MTDKEALKLALEALEYLMTNKTIHYTYRNKAEEALTAIKQALAAPVQRCALCNYQHGHAIGCKNNPVDIALAKLAQPAPVQEPVAWDRPIIYTPPHMAPPAAKRPWIGLTDEERDYIWEKNRTTLGGWDYGGDEVMYDRHFEDAVIAIEAKLKERNQ